jgi:hypothetical protein
MVGLLLFWLECGEDQAPLATRWEEVRKQNLLLHSNQWNAKGQEAELKVPETEKKVKMK